MRRWTRTRWRQRSQVLQSMEGGWKIRGSHCVISLTCLTCGIRADTTNLANWQFLKQFMRRAPLSKQQLRILRLLNTFLWSKSDHYAYSTDCCNILCQPRLHPAPRRKSHGLQHEGDRDEVLAFGNSWLSSIVKKWIYLAEKRTARFIQKIDITWALKHSLLDHHLYESVFLI